MARNWNDELQCVVFYTKNSKHSMLLQHFQTSKSVEILGKWSDCSHVLPIRSCYENCLRRFLETLGNNSTMQHMGVTFYMSLPFAIVSLINKHTSFDEWGVCLLKGRVLNSKDAIPTSWHSKWSAMIKRIKLRIMEEEKVKSTSVHDSNIPVVEL